MADRQELHYRFSAWAEPHDLCLDQIFMSTDGIPENPYLDDTTRLAFDAWMDGRNHAVSTIQNDIESDDDHDLMEMIANIINSNEARLAIDALSLAGLGEWDNDLEIGPPETDDD